MPLRVFAAASLTDLLTAVEIAYEELHPAVDLRIHLAGSNELCEQLLAGARAELFFPASNAEMRRVEEAGLLDGDIERLFSNRLVWVRAEGAAEGDLKRFALADPQAVPAGRYAKQWLEGLGEWERVEAKVAPSPNVRAALALLTAGAAQEGVLYASDLQSAGGLTRVREQTSEELPTITYPGAVLRDSGAEARVFLRWMADSIEAETLANSARFRPAAPVS
ncbi:MAG: molybdate ABC transporter substrate-binding protein [Planctomycetota bacterium]